jgi:hypothetical protein
MVLPVPPGPGPGAAAAQRTVARTACAACCLSVNTRLLLAVVACTQYPRAPWPCPWSWWFVFRVFGGWQRARGLRALGRRRAVDLHCVHDCCKSCHPCYSSLATHCGSGQASMPSPLSSLSPVLCCAFFSLASQFRLKYPHPPPPPDWRWWRLTV